MKLSELTSSVEHRARLLGATPEEIEQSDAAMRLVDAVAKLIVQMRESEGITQAELGDMIGLSGPGRISQFESGQLRHAVNLKTLAKILSVLGYRLVLEAVKADARRGEGIEVRVSHDDETVYYGRERHAATAD